MSITCCRSLIGILLLTSLLLAGETTGENLSVAPTVVATGPALLDEGGRLDGLHVLKDCPETEQPEPAYASMIRHAILGSPKKALSVANIYIILEAKFPYYRDCGTKWKDRIREKLASDRSFVKMEGYKDEDVCIWTVDEMSLVGEYQFNDLGTFQPWLVP